LDLVEKAAGERKYLKAGNREKATVLGAKKSY